MKIAFYKAKYGNWQDKAISIATLSTYSHCELIFSDGVCASSSPRDGGVRFKKIEMDHKWDVFNIVETGSFARLNEAIARNWFILHDGDTYDWIGAIASAVDIDLSSEGKKYCSRSCLLALGFSPWVSTITPGGLYRYGVQGGYFVPAV